MQHHNLFYGFIFAGASLVLFCTSATARLSLPAVINDNMVLQRNIPIPIWGWANAGQKVTVSFEKKAISVIAGDDGKWIVHLEPRQANAIPQTMTIKTDIETRSLKNILIGEVWLASGQSNMAWPVRSASNATVEIAIANYSKLRLFQVGKQHAAQPKDNLVGDWLTCTPTSVRNFSAVAYFFGRNILKTQKIPVGLINSSWSGTPIETWIGMTTFESLGMRDEIMQRKQKVIKIGDKQYPTILRKYFRELIVWEKVSNSFDYHNDGFDLGWAIPGNAPKKWKPAMELLQINFIGAIWFRHEITLPAKWERKSLTLELGAIDDYDTTYVNGIRVGKTDKYRLTYWSHPRVYHIPAYCLKPGKNLIAVRVFNNFGTGNFPGTGRVYPDNNKSNPILLKDNWQCRIERKQVLRKTSKIKPFPSGMAKAASSPSFLYNGMIHPLIPYALRGIIWYQGESNASAPGEYRKLFPAMIKGWRKAWKQQKIAFGFVQLANFRKRATQPTNSLWTKLRDAQASVLSLPDTGMAVAIDIGAADDIHPRNKQAVAKRLALWARAEVYNETISYSGPVFRKMNIENNKIRISFDHVYDGLSTRDDKPLTGFAISGTDGIFVWANAVIDGDSVLVWSNKIKKPVNVRYAWADNPACNLYNYAALPAVPFRTDK